MLRIFLASALLFSTVCQAADSADAFFDDSAVREIRLYFDDANWYNTLYQSHATNRDDPYFPARFQAGAVALPRIGVRFKGNSSFQRNGVKKAFKLDFNEYDDNATFLGLKKLNLNNGDLSPSFLREKMFLDFAGKYIAAMRAVHVRLYVNDAYYGLYVAIEQPDKVMMQSRFGSGEDGNLYEAGESVAANMSYLGANASSYTSRYELKTNETANDYSGLIELLDVLNNTPAADLPAKLEPICDVENMLYGQALNNLFTNLESYLGVASEYYLYDRSRDGRFVQIHWDLNESFGTTGDGTPRLANPFIMDPFYLPTATGGGGFPGGGGAATNSRPLLEKLWAVDSYKRLYLRMLARMLREGFDAGVMGARAQQLAALIRPYAETDPNRVFTMAQFDTTVTGQVNTGQLTIYGITQFVRERYNFLRPLLNSYAQPADVRLNEISASTTEPWVELHNLGPGPVSLSGFYLTDDPSNPTKWPLPNRTIADGAFLVVYLSGDSSKGELYAGFRAANNGSLYLYNSGTALDSQAYPALAANQSYIRTGSLGSTWRVTSQSTPGAENVLSALSGPVSAGTGQLLINEVMADNDAAYPDPDESGAFEDWFEVYNPSDAAIDMTGMYITDNLSNTTKWKVPAGVTIPARGYLVFIADGETTQGARHTSFSLSADGEALAIYATDGTTLIDSMTFSTQRTDVSLGRTTDGAPSWSIFQPATPGASNALPYANWLLNAASFQSVAAAPSSIVSAFDSGFTSTTVAATQSPLPETLGGVTVTVTDSAGTARPAPLFFVSSGQINFLVPPGTANGRAVVAIRRQSGTTLAGDLLVTTVAPALFAADATGKGAGLLAAIRVNAAGEQTPASPPISFGAETDQVYLILYGTGIRGVAGASDVTVEIDGQKIPVTYAGAQPEYTGLDQVNIGPLPRSLAGRGEREIIMTANGHRLNRVTVTFQ